MRLPCDAGPPSTGNSFFICHFGNFHWRIVWSALPDTKNPPSPETAIDRTGPECPRNCLISSPAARDIEQPAPMVSVNGVAVADDGQAVFLSDKQPADDIGRGGWGC